MNAARLDCAERRQAILDAALPVFAERGFAATTTRAVAEAAGVSEALIFKHFPSKTALYEALFLTCVEGDPELARLCALPPSTATLVAFVEGLVEYFLLELPADPAARARHRLLLQSLLGDGSFATLTSRWIASRIAGPFCAALAAAQAAGDAAPEPVAAENGLWFAYHLAAMLATVALPGGAAVAGLAVTDAGERARQVLWFLLRGVGLAPAVIARHVDPGGMPVARSDKDCADFSREG